MKKIIFIVGLAFLGHASLAEPPTHSRGQSSSGKVRPQAKDQQAKSLVLHVKEGIKTLEEFHNWLQEEGFTEEEVVVKLGATWCPPCQALIRSGVLSEYAERNQGKVKVFSLDVDQHKELAKVLNPQGMVPALVTLKNDGVSKPGPAILKYIPGQSSPIGDFLKQ